VATTVLKLLPMLAIVLLGGWLLATEPSKYTQHVPQTPLAFDSMLAASTIALFAMLGIESAAVPADACATRGDDSRATMAGTLITAAIYVAVSSMALLLVRSRSWRRRTRPSRPARRPARRRDRRVLAVFVVISGLGALNAGRCWSVNSRHHGAPRHVAAAARAPQCPWRPRRGVDRHRTAGHGHAADELQQIAGGGLHVPDAGGDGPRTCRCTSSVPSRWSCSGAAARSLRVTCWSSACSARPIRLRLHRLGREPFLWALVLGAAGLPLYFLRHRKPH